MGRIEKRELASRFAFLFITSRVEQNLIAYKLFNNTNQFVCFEYS